MRKCCLLLAVLMLLGMLSGCGSGTDETAAVQSVSMLCGLGSVGTAERFGGIVSARSEQKINADSSKTVGEILVEEGDEVTAGQVLFTYDMELAELNLEKAELELEQMKNTLDSKTREKETLEKEKEKASAANQLSYTLEIQECETAIREQNYNIALKEKEVQRLRDSLGETEYVSPMDGRVQTINEPGSTDSYGNEQALITLVEAGAYRVKGYINENNVMSLSEGTPVLVRSRVDSSLTWSGTVYMIDWENPVSASSDSYYYEDSASSEMSNSSKYPFYVELDSADGLLLGQHVYIEPDYGQNNSDEAVLALPEYYFAEIDGEKGIVWAENGSGKLEKRTVTLGEYDADMGTYVIVSGLTAEDYIAFPDESLKAGMVCEEYDTSAFEVTDDYGEEYYEDEYSGEEFGEFENYEAEFEEAYEEAGEESTSEAGEVG